MKIINSIKIRNILVVLLSTLMIILTACSESSFDLNELSDEDDKKLTSLLGDLNYHVSESVKNEIGSLLHKVEAITELKESESIYTVSAKERKLWKKINKLLDKETKKQFGEFDFASEDEEDLGIDYGGEIIQNLNNTVSDEDCEELDYLRNEYLNPMMYSDTDIVGEITGILDKYESLDADAVLLNLLDTNNEENFGMLYITDDLQAVYQSGYENGLKEVSENEQQALQNCWKAVTDILPVELFTNFEYFKIGGDGELGTYAYVMPVDDEGKTWCMTVDPYDIKDDGIFPYTVVHEISHYLTLNDSQVVYDYGEGLYSRDVYADTQCVAKENSYIQAYYDLFWKDIICDWAIDPEDPYFYIRHMSEFVTAYAATSCAEDLAETFSAYVLMSEADTPIIRAKFDFFDSYEEFRLLKQQILTKIKNNNVYVSPQIEIFYDDEYDYAA